MIFDAVGVGHCAWLVYFITRNLWLVHIQHQHQHRYPLSYHRPLPVIHIYHLSSYISLLVCSCKAAEKHDVDTEAPAQADTKPQIVRVNSGNTTICNTIVIQTHTLMTPPTDIDINAHLCFLTRYTSMMIMTITAEVLASSQRKEAGKNSSWSF